MEAAELLTGAWALPGWVAGAAAALIVVLLVLAFSRNDMLGTVNVVFRYALVLAGVVLTWNFIAQGVSRDHFLERQVLDSRAAALLSRALAPGSPLACLDGITVAAIEKPCEASLFATPANVAAATAYTAARLALLADGMAYVRTKDRGYASALAGLQRTLAADRFGLVAHVLAMRDGCTTDRCAAFALFRDPDQIRANLAARTFNGYVAQYSRNWPSGTDAVAAVTRPAIPSSAPGANAAEGSPSPPAGASRKAASRDLFFPSSDSIPAVNIMTPEPPLPKSSAASKGSSAATGSSSRLGPPDAGIRSPSRAK